MNKIKLLNNNKNVFFKSNKTVLQPNAYNASSQDEFTKTTSASELPQGKAIKVTRKLKIGILNILLLPFGFIGFGIKPKMELIDIDMDNLSRKEEKMLQKGKILTNLPVGYKIVNGTIKEI